jgi:hypothetical protein
MKKEVPVKKLVLLVTVLLAGLSLPALGGPTMADPPLAVHKERRDLTLENAAMARTQKLAALLQPEARAKLDLATRALLAHLASAPENADPFPMVQREVHSRFAHLSGEQSDLLSFYVLAEAARIITVPDELKRSLDGANEMSEMTALRLQMDLDKMSKYISTLRNIMKKISATEDTLVQNIR